MEISNSLLFNEGFTNALNSLLNIKLPITTSLDIANCIQDVENQRVVVYKVRDGILKRRNEDTSEEVKAETTNSLNEMFNEKFELSIESKIKLPKSTEISVKDVLVLIDIIESEE